MTQSSMTRRRWACVGSLLLTLTALYASAAGPRRVLILDSFGRDVAPFNVVASAFRTTLAGELGEPVDLHHASLETGRFADPGTEGHLADFLQRRFAGRRLDLVVPIGAPAAGFVARYRSRLFPAAPVLFAAGDPRLVGPEFVATNATQVTFQVNLPRMVEDILQLQPATTNIAVVLGASPLEKYWEGECRREFQRFTNRVSFCWLSDLSLEQMRERVAALPARSFVLFTMFTMDGTGVPYDNEMALKALRAVAKAPMFGYFASQFGFGTVGGRLYPDERLGVQAARVSIRILRGEAASSIAPQLIAPPVPVYDWRELKRWGISEARLPPGSIIEFRQPTIWSLYKWRIIAIVWLCLLEAVLIVLLVANLVRRRRAEQSARDLSGRLINAQEEERARLARELHDDITQRLARLAIDVGRCEFGTADVSPAETAHEVREGLVRLSEDVHALAYRLHPAVLEDLGLAEALKAEGERFAGRQSIPVHVKLQRIPEPVPREAALGVFRIAQEALRNAARHAQARAVELSLREVDGGLQLAVQDDGCGFDPALERDRPSLGLASMRERVHLLGGELDIDSAPRRGTTIVAWVPLKKGSA